MMQPLEIHRRGDRATRQAGSSPALRIAASRLASQLGDGDRVLLARTDAALLVCGAAAMLRQSTTHIERAPVGRTGWFPPAKAILVEVSRPTPGLTRTLLQRWPDLEMVVAPIQAAAEVTIAA